MENNRDGKFLTGFLLGAIIGAGIVFLFGTKKGKKLLKTISEEGLDDLSDFLESGEEEEVVGEDKREEEKPKEELGHQVKQETPKPLVRRFFRRLAKRG